MNDLRIKPTTSDSSRRYLHMAGPRHAEGMRRGILKTRRCVHHGYIAQAVSVARVFKEE